MDPDECLHEILVLARDIAEGDDYHKKVNTDDAEGLAERLIGLHEWIVGGGALPKMWRTK